MPRKKPTTEIDIIGNLDLSPDKCVGDYIESKNQDEFFVKPPNWDSAGDSVELLFIRNKREHVAMLDLQKEMLTNAKRQAAVNSTHMQRLYKYQANLRKRFIEVNSFIKDCVDKKSVSEKKVAEETARHEVLKEDIQKYMNDTEVLSKFRDVLKANVKEFEPYEKVLQDVVDKSDIFVSIKDCMDRCDALMLAQVEISRLEQEKIQDIEEMRKRMVKITKEAALTVLGLKNDLAELERSYIKSKAECSKWEQIMARAKTTVTYYDLNKDRTLDGIFNMYRMLCKRRHIEPTILYHELEKQLDFIIDEVDLLQEAHVVCKRIMKGEKFTSEKYGELKSR